MIKFTIPIPPVTKKNSMKPRMVHGQFKGLLQSDQYRQYESDCLKLITGQYKLNIDCPVNIKALYFMPTHRRVDLINLHSALHDILVKANVLMDDNCQIVVSTDGSRVLYDKENPRTEVTITPYE